MSMKPNGKCLRFPSLPGVVLSLAMGMGALQAMESPGSGSSSSAQARPRVPLFSLTSHLAASDEARAFIGARLAMWELEKASFRAMAETTRDYFSSQLEMNRADLERIHRRHSSGVISEDECIINDEYSRFVEFEKAPFIASFRPHLPMIDRVMNADLAHQKRRIIDVCGISCDEIHYGSFGNWDGFEKRESELGISDLLALFKTEGFGDSSPSKFVQYLKTLDETIDYLSTLDQFVFEWMQHKQIQLKADVQRLEAHLIAPGALAEKEPKHEAGPEPDLDEEDLLVEAKTTLIPESKDPVLAHSHPRVTSAQRAPSPGTPPRRFDEYYRFVDCSRPPRVERGRLKVGKGVARIRAEVDARSMHLTSTDVIHLAKALAPYGARCEAHRKKGIMIKLPALNPEVGFVAKFIHRTHPSHDSIDVNTLEALKDLFDASIFSMDKF